MRHSFYSFALVLVGTLFLTTSHVDAELLCAKLTLIVRGIHRWLPGVPMILHSVNCMGSFPGVSSIADLTILATPHNGLTANPVSVNLGGSIANSTSLKVEIVTHASDVNFSVIILGPSS